jgi:PST family polysaccharide transporter
MEVCGSEALAFGSFIVLARLLAPADFGIVSQATLMVMGAQLVLQQGLPEALVQRQGLAESHFDSAFWANLTLGGGIMAMFLAGAPLIASALDEPRLAQVLRWLSPTLLMFAASRIVLARLRRHLQFQGLLYMNVAATAAGAATGIVMALAGFGLWSLVAQQWAYAFAGLVIGWTFCRWRPMFRLVRGHIREFWTFSRFTILEAVLAFCARRLDLLILGLFWPAAEIGYYFLANRLLFSAGMMTYYSIGQLGLPILSKLTNDPEAFREAIYRMAKLVSLSCLPTLIGLALIAPMLVPLTFGAEWSASIAPFQALSALSVFYALNLSIGQIMLAAGYARECAMLSALSVVLFLLAVGIAAPHGITAAAFAGGIANMLVLPAYLLSLKRLFGIDLGRLLRDQAPLWAASLGMVVGVLWCQQAVDADLGPWPALILSTTVGAGIFIAVMAAMALADLRDIYLSFAGLWRS